MHVWSLVRFTLPMFDFVFFEFVFVFVFFLPLEMM